MDHTLNSIGPEGREAEGLSRIRMVNIKLWSTCKNFVRMDFVLVIAEGWEILENKKGDSFVLVNTEQRQEKGIDSNIQKFSEIKNLKPE